MTTEEIKEAAKVMEAYANGKKIQIQNYDKTWNDCPSPVFNWGAFKYRVKPEIKYRPFKTQEECWDEMHKHPDLGWVKDIKSGECLQIVCVTDEGVYCFKHSVSSHLFKSLVQEFNFTDGTPFGIKEE